MHRVGGLALALLLILTSPHPSPPHQAVRLPHHLGPAPTCWGQLKGIYASSARTEALRSHVTEHHVREQARESATSLP